MLPLRKGTENTTALCVLATEWVLQSWSGGAQKRQVWGICFQKHPLCKKADNHLEYKVFAARPKKKKKKILVPLSCLELWPKEAWEPAILKHWLLADSSSGWSRIQTVKYAHMGAKCKVQAPWGAGECLWQVSGWCPHWHISFINNWV